MTDPHLRELERRFRTSGSVEDEAAWLRARAQAGELEQSKLELAAYLGSEAAQAECKGESELLGLQGRLLGLRFLERQGCARLAISVVRAALPIWQARLPVDERLPAAIRCAEDWVLCPCDEHFALANEAGEACIAAGALQWDVVREVARLAGVAGRCGELGPEAIGSLQSICNPWDTRCGKLVEECFKLPGELVFRNAIRAELVPWALGYSDPVRERVEAREAANE